MIEQLKDFPPRVLAFVCKGKVTAQDYKTVLEPAVDEVLKQPGKVRLYYETDASFENIAFGAMWEDFKVGVEHLLRWERVALVTDVDWIANTLRAFGWLIHGELKVFPQAEAEAAKAWIKAD